MGRHARLQPSSAKRWMICPGSVELCSNVVDAGSTYADEGTAGHACFEALITGRPVPTEVVIDSTRKWPVTDDLLALVKPCVEWVADYKKLYKAAIFSEQKYEIGAGFGLKPGLFWGTADFTALSRTELCIADLKLGYNDVPVEDNEQLISYGLGALDATGWLHDKVRLVILQPRTSDEPKVKVYTAAEMAGFRERWTPKVLTAARGGPLVAEDDACKWCKAAGACPELRAQTLALAQREMANLITLSGEEIADLLDKGSMIENAMKAVRAHALKLLELDPTAVPGYKRVQGEKHRAWIKGEEDVKTALDRLRLGLTSEDWYERKLRSPAQVETRIVDTLVERAKLDATKLTKKDAKEIAKNHLAGLAQKPPGEPTIVKEKDARPALAPAFTADDVRELDTQEVID